MNLKRVFQNMSDLSGNGVIPRGIIDEGRIFSLGVFVNEDHLHGRVVDVVEGLKEHVGQPFELHPWAFVYDISTFKQDGRTSPITLVGFVWPQADGSVVVKDYIALPKYLRYMKQFTFRHTTDGTTVKRVGSDGNQDNSVDASLYPLAIAMLNTRGCSIDLKRAPKIENAKRNRQGKTTIPAHFDVDASEYFTALNSAKYTTNRDGTHASPIPHLRRAHERVLANGKRIWITSALINVRNEGDIAFVERRKSYRRREVGLEPSG
jgi:hypothetical protein